MLRNYILVTFRNLSRNKSFSLINIIGLSISMSVCLLLLSIAIDQFSYDKFHTHHERVFRITTKKIAPDGSTALYATAPAPIRSYLKDQYEFITDGVVLKKGANGEALANKKTILVEGIFAEEDFFKVFTFDLKQGNPSALLTKAFSVVLTEKTARKF